MYFDGSDHIVEKNFSVCAIEHVPLQIYTNNMCMHIVEQKKLVFLFPLKLCVLLCCAVLWYALSLLPSFDWMHWCVQHELSNSCCYDGKLPMSFWLPLLFLVLWCCTAFRFISFHVVVVVALVIIQCTHALYRASQVQYVLLGSLYALRCVSASIYKMYMPATYGLSYFVRSTCQFKLFTHAWAQIGRYTYVLFLVDLMNFSILI